MRDAIGGAVNVTFIAFFLVIVSGYLAFTVSYNKAFRVKNKIINVLEQYEDVDNRNAQEIIRNYLQEIGYNAQLPSACNKDGYQNHSFQQEGYCVKWVPVSDNSSGLPRGYYKVMTAVYVDLPILNKAMPFLEVFTTSGDTKTIYASHQAD